MDIETYYLSDGILQWTILAVALIGFVVWKKLFKSLKIFSILYALAFTSTIGVTVLLSYHITPNYAVNLYALFDFCFLLWMYYEVFASKRLRAPFLVIGLLATVFGILNYFFIQKSEPNTYTVVIGSLVIIFLSLYYFYWLLSNLQFEKPQSEPFFWINSGIAIYRVSTILLLMAREYLVNIMNDDMILLWTYHNIMAILANLLSLYGLWIAGRNKPSQIKSRILLI